MVVSSLVSAAFASAAEKQPEISKAWIQVSIRLGGMVPRSLLMPTLQRDGALDVVLRCMEDEHATGQEQSLSNPHYQKMLSELWVGGVYESLRLLAERELLPTSDDVTALAEHFRLLRVPLAKQEIASQGQLKAPLKFQKFPPKGDQSAYEYDKSDPKRSHIMPTGFSARGSVTWQALDIKKGQERWIERRDLSDRIVALWGAPATASSQRPSAA